MLLFKTINSDGGFCAAPAYAAANEDTACLVKSPKFTIQITPPSFKLQLRCCGNDDISSRELPYFVYISERNMHRDKRAHLPSVDPLASPGTETQHTDARRHHSCDRGQRLRCSLWGQLEGRVLVRWCVWTWPDPHYTTKQWRVCPQTALHLPSRSTRLPLLTADRNIIKKVFQSLFFFPDISLKAISYD